MTTTPSQTIRLGSRLDFMNALLEVHELRRRVARRSRLQYLTMGKPAYEHGFPLPCWSFAFTKHQATCNEQHYQSRPSASFVENRSPHRQCYPARNDDLAPMWNTMFTLAASGCVQLLQYYKCQHGDIHSAWTRMTLRAVVGRV